MELVTRARLVCPHCGGLNDTEMPLDSCQVFFECLSCRAFLRPRAGDCCVFCSYSDVQCPPKQMERADNNIDTPK
jgi:hypothetical protein